MSPALTVALGWEFITGVTKRQEPRSRFSQGWWFEGTIGARWPPGFK
ncbi:MAG: hypothetical protein ACFB12_16100 [Leptolyngbyaceae cyanobacterium]